MKPLKVQIIEFFLDHLMRQHHEIERDLSKKIDQPNVIQMYSLDNYRNTFLEQIKLGKEVGLSTEEIFELASLVRKDEYIHFENFADLGVGSYVARLEFGGSSTAGNYDLFRYKDHYLMNSQSVSGHNHYRLAAGDEIAAPFFMDFSLREEYGEQGITEYSAFRPMLMHAEDSVREELRTIFTGFVHLNEPDADELATLFSMMASETDFQLFEQNLRRYKGLYDEAPEDAYTLLRMVVPDPERITFTFKKDQLATWLETLSDLHIKKLTGYLFMVLSQQSVR